MTHHKSHKPSVEEWLHWADLVVARLTDCVRVYKRPPHADAFVPESERQKKTDMVVSHLRRIHQLADNSDTPSDSVAEAHHHDERTIGGLIILFEETLAMLPWLSADMQKMLKSPWMSKFPNQTAHVIFAGHNAEEEGIGSGHREHGRMPAILAQLLEREHVGETRHPRAELLRHGEPRRNDPDARNRWAEQNSRFLRTAGRVE